MIRNIVTWPFSVVKHTWRAWQTTLSSSWDICCSGFLFRAKSLNSTCLAILLSWRMAQDHVPCPWVWPTVDTWLQLAHLPHSIVSPTHLLARGSATCRGRARATGSAMCRDRAWDRTRSMARGACRALATGICPTQAHPAKQCLQWRVLRGTSSRSMASVLGRVTGMACSLAMIRILPLFWLLLHLWFLDRTLRF